ncbi:hypothetical protein [Wolbachia endosymbiont (group A) of Agelastica alni]|uniref:hypothetical protein n=1 Tax=Wolbachia endosymbiont (group A) of Agelastica alni TaxID=3066130 RepID=UPI0033401E8E
MPNTRERETVRALVSAFNVNNYDFNAVKTNFKLQSKGKKDYIVVSFEKSMDTYQCRGYLDSIKRKIIREFYGIEESNDAEILDTAKLIFDVNSFPFYISDRDWSWDKQHGFKFVTPVDKGVIFNLKSHLASSLKKDVLEGMPTCSIFTNAFDKKKYLWRGEFDNKGLRKQFESEFLSRMENGYENVPKKPLEVKGNSVYIKDVFDDARFIDSVTRRAAWRIGIDLGVGNDVDHSVMLLKDSIINSVYQSTKIIVVGFICASPLNREEASILIPLVLGGGGKRILTSEEALKLNYAFDGAVFYNLYDRTQGELSTNGSSGIYGIDFSNKEISHCVITKIIESSVINKDHELAIDPERALSPAQSPLNSLTHAGPSGLRTPPKQRQEDRDSGYDSNSPPKPKDSGASSGGPGPSSKMSQPQLESPTRSQDVALEGSPRQESEQKQGLYYPVNLAGTSKGFWPPTQLSYTTVSQGVSGPSSQSVSAAENVQVGTSQSMNLWSSPASSTGLWSLPQMSSFVSGPSSSKGANPVGANLWTKNSNPLPPLPPLVSLIPLPVSGSSVSGFSPLVSFTSTQNPYPLPPPPPLIPSSGGIVPRFRLPVARPSSSRGAQAGANISEKEEKLIEALLYTLNLTNYTYGGVYTNFFAKDGKIVSLLHDNVDREKYFQAVEEYCKGEEEARGLCDLNEFPFKLNYEEKKGKTVVANISSGALSNLKILFSQKFGKNVDAIDISAVKKVEKREKDEWVDRQRSEGDSLEEACQDCFPDEGAMKIIPIAFEGGEYVLDRSGDTCEVNLSFKGQLRRFRGTSLEKRKSSDKPLTEEEKNLFKELLYAFNYSNNNFDLPDTNFIVKNGKIASLIPDSVDVKEYLEEVIDKTKEKYYVNEKEEYYVNDFPFKFLPNCEKNQETTVVANISRGALFNLKKLFIYGYKKKAETGDIDINTVEEAVKSKKYELVNSKVKGIEREGGYYDRIKHDEAVTACYPDKNALEDIPIGKYETGYRLDRTFNDWETKLLLEELKYAKDKSKAKKMKSEDNKDSGISSGEATDAENVSSKAEATTSSGTDCENTRGGSPKRTLELSVGMEELTISTDLDATEVEQHSPIKKFRSN